MSYDATLPRRESVASISAWQVATFGEAAEPWAIAARALTEMAELARGAGTPVAVEEAADVVITLCRLAQVYNLSTVWCTVTTPVTPRITTERQLIARANTQVATLLRLFEDPETVDAGLLAATLGAITTLLGNHVLMSGGNLFTEIDRKMAINRSRVWGPHQHVKPPGAEHSVDRPTWEEYFLAKAELESTRATCLRAKVGAVIAKGHRTLATGYNGAPAGEPHCLEVGCLLEDGHCQRSLHAEVNAVAQAAIYGFSVADTTMYVYTSDGREPPCRECYKVLKAVRLAGVVYRDAAGTVNHKTL